MWLQTDRGVENRLGVRQEMIVMGLIIAAVISLPQVDRIMEKQVILAFLFRVYNLFIFAKNKTNNLFAELASQES